MKCSLELSRTFIFYEFIVLTAAKHQVLSDIFCEEEKLSILKSMEADARELEIADEENMSGGEQHSLASVRRAVRAVDPEAAARSEAAQTSKAL